MSLQRNTSGQTLHVRLSDGEVAVEPGGEVEHGLHIAGFSPVEEDGGDSAYASMLKADLIALAESRDIDSSGTKAEIADRLLEADAAS